MGLFGGKHKDDDRDKGKRDQHDGSSSGSAGKHSRSQSRHRSKSPLPPSATHQQQRQHSPAALTAIDCISDREAFAAAKVISTLEAQSLRYDLPRAVTLLRGRFCQGDASRAVVLALALRDAEDMVLVECNDLVLLQGAENKGTTCYLDALLFAMYARSFPLFDAMLYSTSTADGGGAQAAVPGASRLAADLRLWVNLMRSGQLVTMDLVSQLQSSIARCGWADASSSEQQDTTECFGFLAEALSMPMLTFKVFIAHGGREDAAGDHKLVQERFLALSVPEPTTAQKAGHEPLAPIGLVDLIDSHFHTKLSVRRAVSVANGKAFEAAGDELPSYQESSRKSHMLGGKGAPPRFLGAGDKKTPREVSLPAWQMFELVPQYTPNDSGAAQQMLASQPPVVAICLKRYYFDSSGQAVLNTTPIVVPEYIDFSPFSDARVVSMGAKSVRLQLDSAVCHRGRHVISGHYVAISRGAQPGQWLLFDDLSPNRVSQASFEQLFGTETPYLLFYQLQVADNDHGAQATRPGAATLGRFLSTNGQRLRGASFYGESIGMQPPSQPPAIPLATKPRAAAVHDQLSGGRALESAGTGAESSLPDYDMHRQETLAALEQPARAGAASEYDATLESAMSRLPEIRIHDADPDGLAETAPSNAAAHGADWSTTSHAAADAEAGHGQAAAAFMITPARSRSKRDRAGKTRAPQGPRHDPATATATAFADGSIGHLDGDGTARRSVAHAVANMTSTISTSSHGQPGTASGVGTGTGTAGGGVAVGFDGGVGGGAGSGVGIVHPFSGGFRVGRRREAAAAAAAAASRPRDDDTIVPAVAASRESTQSAADEHSPPSRRRLKARPIPSPSSQPQPPPPRSTAVGGPRAGAALQRPPILDLLGD